MVQDSNEATYIPKIHPWIIQPSNCSNLEIRYRISWDMSWLTADYIKPTDNGIYPSLYSYTSNKYKRSMVKILVQRSMKYFSLWKELGTEIIRLCQEWSCELQSYLDEKSVKFATVRWPSNGVSKNKVLSNIQCSVVCVKVRQITSVQCYCSWKTEKKNTPKYQWKQNCLFNSWNELGIICTEWDEKLPKCAETKVRLNLASSWRDIHVMWLNVKTSSRCRWYLKMRTNFALHCLNFKWMTKVPSSF